MESDGSRNAGRESLGGIVTAGTVLFEDLLTAIGACILWMFVRMLRAGRGRVRLGLAQSTARNQGQAAGGDQCSIAHPRSIAHVPTLQPLHDDGVTGRSGVCHQIVGETRVMPMTIG